MEASGSHNHCDSCVKIRKCNVRPEIGVSCEIVACDLDCGARFHQCKGDEHKLLCPNEKVRCVNYCNGCPVIMLRSKTGCHLERCPASVVHCTMEWNRWPVCSTQEQTLHLPLDQQKKPDIQSNPQLDVALAMRDQRMLNQWFNVPNATKDVLKNSLTERHPAVPYKQQNNESQSSFHEPLDMSAVIENKKAPPGLQLSVCQELYKASLKATESLSAAINIATHGHSVDNNEIIANSQIDNELIPYNKSNDAVLDRFKFEDELMDIACNSKHDDPKVLKDVIENLKNNEKQPHKSCEQLFVDNNIASEISSASMMDHATQQPSPPPFVLYSNLINEEDERSDGSPEFRRDEYRWHYKNIHSDIHGGLNGWLEQRCPLAHHGCMFSVRRFFPTIKGACIVHNDILESFGIQPPSESSKTASSHLRTNHDRFDNDAADKCEKDLIRPNKVAKHKTPIHFLDLPFEILQNVCRCLDGFGLCNASMTCHLLREVCRSLLEERGIVVLHWQRIKTNDTQSWKVAYKRWFFSTAITPITHWGFEDKESLGNHLQSCSFFKRDHDTEPFFYPFGIKPNPDILNKLKKSILNDRPPS